MEELKRDYGRTIEHQEKIMIELDRFFFFFYLEVPLIESKIQCNMILA